MKLLFTMIVAVLFAQIAVAQSGYRIKPGDTLSISVLEDPSLNSEALVRPDGGISLLIAGDVRAAGQTVSGLRSILTQRYASNFAITPTVSVALLALAPPPEPRDPVTIDIYVLGEVEAPGLKELKPGVSLLQAISTAGGLSRFAAHKRIQLRRRAPDGTEQMSILNYDAVQRGAGTRNIILRDGDVILVPERRLFE